MSPLMRLVAALICACGLVATPAPAQEYGTTPGAVPDPSTYQGSQQLQQQEQQRFQQQEQLNQQMLRRLDDNYQQYAPQQSAPGSRGGNAAGGAPAVDWWSRPALAAERNPLLGRWKQVPARGVSGQQVNAASGGLLPGADSVASLVNGAMAGGCKSMFGTGVVAFEADSLQWVAPDGHEEVLNHVAYRASGSEVVVLSRDPGAIPALIFGFPNHDNAVVAFFSCEMQRYAGARPPPAQATPPAPSTGTNPTPQPRLPASTGAADSVIVLRVGVSATGSFTPLAGIQIWVTRDDPSDALARASVAVSGASLAEQFSADCRDARQCTRDLQIMTAKALGAVQTDASGHAQTPHIPAGNYYLVGIAPYQGKALFWGQRVVVRSGSNDVTLDQTNSLLK